MTVDLDRVLIELQRMFPEMEDSHDVGHFKRVLGLVNEISKTEGGNLEVLQIGALVHDVHRLMEHEAGHFVEPKDSLEKVQELLEKSEVPQSLIPGVLHCVKYHDEYPFTAKGNPVTDIETLILQDADNIDAIGAIGLARCIMYSTRYGVKLYDEKVSLDDTQYDPTLKDPSAIHHMHRKLLKLVNYMNTPTGKKLALQRSNIIKDFIEQLILEWK